VDLGYSVTKRGPNGEALAIQCKTHEACPWTLSMSGAKRDDDPIYKFQFAQHLADVKSSGVQAFGHARRKRL
jgi:hypothetical protein